MYPSIKKVFPDKARKVGPEVRYLKFVKWLLAGLVVIALIGLAVWLGARGCGEEGSAAPTASQYPDWCKPQTYTTPVIPNPFKPTEAEKRTKGFPAGSKVVVLNPGTPQEVEIVILPNGEILTPQGVDAVVYVKRPAVFALEVRPVVGVGFSAASKFGPGVLAGVDVVKLGPARVGVGALVDPIKPISVAGGLTVGADVYNNVGVRGFAGAGNRGWTYGAAMEIAIVKSQ